MHTQEQIRTRAAELGWSAEETERFIRMETEMQKSAAERRMREAAPQLVEALQRVRRHVHTVGDVHFVEMCETALRAAGVEPEKIGSN